VAAGTASTCESRLAQGDHVDGGGPVSFKLDLDRDELLALLSYMTIGLNYSAICSGEGSFLSPNEIALHLTFINSQGAERLQAKVAAAAAYAADQAQSQRDL
jgi:hypothetical protein